MIFLQEGLVNGISWWRIADPRWSNPLDSSFSRQHGNRWSPPDSFGILYFNEDEETARLNLRRLVSRQPYEIDDLNESEAPILIQCRLPDFQMVCNAHSVEGLEAMGLPASYPLSSEGEEVDWSTCQAIGVKVKKAKLNGIHCRSAADRTGRARELAWFPDDAGGPAYQVAQIAFRQWFLEPDPMFAPAGQ